MPELSWSFAKNDGGRDSGLHDAGVETFKGNFDRYLAREMIQNSLDARHDPNNPVLVKFELLQLNRNEIPDMDGLKATLARCAEYWNHDKKAKDFFGRAETNSKQDKITGLRIGDSNTTGVLGSDTERSKNWYNLIRQKRAVRCEPFANRSLFHFQHRRGARLPRCRNPRFT
jgi:hypothetical protein